MRKTVRACCAIAGSAALLVLPACWAAGASTAGAVEVSPRAAPAASSVTIAAVGDTMLGTTPDLPPNPGSYLDAVRPILDRGAQVVFGNLEGTLTTATASKCGAGRFTGTGRPVPGGGGIAFTARLGTEDFGSSAARIMASGVIKAP